MPRAEIQPATVKQSCNRQQLSRACGGKVKALGVTSAKRSQALPRVAAIAETLPGFRIEAWYGFMGRPGMPRDMVAKINADVATIVRRPDFQKRLTDDALEPILGTPEEFAA